MLDNQTLVSDSKLLIFEGNLAFLKRESRELDNKPEVFINISEKIQKHKKRLAIRLTLIFLICLFFLGGLKSLQVSAQLLNMLWGESFDSWIFVQSIFFFGFGCILTGLSIKFVYSAIIPLILTYGPYAEDRVYMNLIYSGTIGYGYIESIINNKYNDFTITYKYKVGGLTYYQTYSTSKYIQQTEVLVLYTDYMAIPL